VGHAPVADLKQLPDRPQVVALFKEKVERLGAEELAELAVDLRVGEAFAEEQAGAVVTEL
jgi:hypothetical protein